MSDLDYEDEYILAENEIPVPSASINVVNLKTEDEDNSPDNSLQTSVLNTKQVNEDNSSSNSLLTENGKSNEIKDVKNGVENVLDDGEIVIGESIKKYCDLEEGELNDSTDEESDRAVCRFFQNGSCCFGQQCRFIHIGDNAYKMFDKISISSSMANQLFGQYNSFNIPVTDSTNIKSTWEDGILKAKKLILESKYKKEEDVEFEEKKLYLSLPENKIERPKGISCKRKIDDYQNKGNKNFNLGYQSKLYKPYKHTNLKRHIIDSKAVTSAQTWIDPWRRSRSRTRNESKSFSSSSSQSSDWCSESCCSDRSTSPSVKESYSLSKNKLSSSQSKLDRAFDRTFSSRRRQKVFSSSDRSRSPMISRKHSLTPLSRSKQKKHIIRKFHSRSPSSSADERSRKHTKKEIEKPFIKKSTFCNIVQTIPPKQTKDVHLDNKHTRSPYLSELESTCSDMSISSLNCTSVSSLNSHSLKNEPLIKKEISEFGKLTSKKSEDFLKSYASDIDNKRHSKKSENVQKFAPAKISKPTFKLGYESTTEVKLEHKKSIPDINTTFNKQNKNQSKSAKKHPASAVEIELLRFASACDRHKIDNQIHSGQTTKSSITLPVKKKVMSKKDEKCEVSAAPPQVKKPVTRREQLLMQLKAIEMAIAKKKSLVSPQK